MKKRHILVLSDIVNVVSKIHGVVGILFFGSLARGDFDEYSDYDLLVLFEDKDLMWRSWDELFRVVGDLKLNLHLIPETLEELKTANPEFLNELLRYGKVLLARLPLEAFLQPVKLEPFCLITYDMSSLNYRDKMKVVYFLYQRGRVGAVAGVGGVKLSEGCVLVPKNAGNEIITKLSSLGVGAKKMEIHLSADSLKAWLDQKAIIA